MGHETNRIPMLLSYRIPQENCLLWPGIVFFEQMYCKWLTKRPSSGATEGLQILNRTWNTENLGIMFSDRVWGGWKCCFASGITG